MVAAQNRLVDVHIAWTEQQLAKGDLPFHPEEHPDGSDYNQHHVEIEADGEALDDLAVASALATGQRPPFAAAEPDMMAGAWPADDGEPDEQMILAAAGHDSHAGGEELHQFWTRGEGLPLWAESPRPWTTLVAHLMRFPAFAKNPDFAKRTAAEWFHEVFGFWPGSDLNRVTHGQPPRGEHIGPG